MMTDQVFSIAVAGPTAGGKTALAIALAERLSGEIISADSMQIYREFKLGTAKPTPEELKRVRHHLIDIRSLSEPYSAADFATDALKAAREIQSREKLPILCGGTGLYLSALMTGRHEGTPKAEDPAYRASLQALAEAEEGKDALYRKLLTVDPTSAEKIHKNNTRRVIRALEIFHVTGKPKSVWDAEAGTLSKDIEVLPILLDYHDRAILYRRIEARVDKMVREGLIEEAEALYRSGLLQENTTAGQAIGYKEFLPYFCGSCDKETAVAELKTATRRYAKRQLTWFRADPAYRALFADNEDGSMKSEDRLLSEAIDLIAKTPRLLSHKM